MQAIHSGLGLGRVPSSNQRRLSAYPLEAIQSDRFYRNWLVPGSPSHQGTTSHCTMHALNHLLTAHPEPRTQLPVIDGYNFAQTIDYWPGEDYDGTSVDAVLQYARKMGRIREYRWTTSVDVMAAHVLETGPAIFGTDFYEHMAVPRGPEEWMEIGGANIGGHAYLIPLAHTREQYFGVLNSWGDWAENGRARMSFETAQRLLDTNGECALVTKW